MDHAHGTWDDRLIAMSHPVSSAVLTPYTHIYGYLGMVNPAQRRRLSRGRRLRHFGVLPTYNWPDAAQLSNPPPYLVGTFTHARFFSNTCRCPTSIRRGLRTICSLSPCRRRPRVFRRDDGVAFVRSSRREEAPASFTQDATRNPEGDQSLLTPGATQEEVITRRLEDVNVARVAGSLPGWPAYNDERLFGLDPRQAYAWSPRPRDLSAPRISALSEGVMIEQSGRHDGFTRFRFREATASDRIPLGSSNGALAASASGLSDGRTRTSDAVDFDDDPSGATVHPEGEGLFCILHGKAWTYAQRLKPIAQRIETCFAPI